MKILLGCYRQGEAEEGEIYIRAVSSVLAQYPESVVRYVTDPRTGLPSKCKFVPTIYEVRTACEAKMKPLVEAEKRLHASRESEADQQPELTPEEQERRKEFIRQWRGSQAMSQSDGMRLDEMDVRKITKAPELRAAVVAAHEEKLARLQAHSEAMPIAVGVSPQEDSYREGRVAE